MLGNIFSPALFKENFKRGWSFAAVAFIICFAGAPLRFMRESYNSVSYSPADAFYELNFSSAFIAAVLPVCLAMLIFAYLHKTSFCSSMHAMPYTRKSLYITNCVSVVILSVLPLLLNGVIMLIFLPEDCSFAMVAEWFGFHVIAVCFVAAMSVVAAMLTGNGILQLLTTGGLNFVIPALFLLGAVLGEQYIYGWDSDNIIQYAEYLNPFFFCIEGGVGFFEKDNSLLFAIIYLLISAALFNAGYCLYKLRKLERWGESYVFGAARNIILVVLVVFAGTFTGLLLADTFDLEDFIGYFIGGLVSLIVSVMIVKKSTRVFNKSIIKPALVCAVAMILLICGFKFDIFGLGKIVPDASRIESVSINGITGFNSYTDESAYSFSDEDNIRMAVEFNKAVLSKVQDFKNYDIESDMPDWDDEWRYVDLEFKLKNGKRCCRNYHVTLSFLEESSELKAIYESEEARRQYQKLPEIEPESIEYFDMTLYENNDPEKFKLYDSLYEVAGEYGCGFDLKQLSDRDQAALLNAIADDYMNISYEVMLEDTGWEYVTGYIDIEYYDSEKNCRWYTVYLSEQIPETVKLLAEFAEEGKLKSTAEY